MKRKKRYNNVDEWKKICSEIHNNKYNYDKVEYVNAHTNVIITCPIHGDFPQLPNNHIKGFGCKYCNSVITNYQFIKDAKKIHGDRYDYSKVNYKGKDKNVTIICPIHGEFSQIASDHVNNKSGCPICNESKLEIEIRKILNDNNIEFEQQKKFKWLGRQSLDFYIPKYNIAIECQGEQHYKLVDFGNKGEEWAINNLKKIKELDNNKLKLCKENNINLLYFSKERYYDNIIIDENKLIQNIIS